LGLPLPIANFASDKMPDMIEISGAKHVTAGLLIQQELSYIFSFGDSEVSIGAVFLILNQTIILSARGKT